MSRRALALAAFALLLPTAAIAQSIHGVVVDRRDAPVAGVVVVLLDKGTTVARALSTENGEFRLAAPGAGSYRVRTLRIGFLPATSELIALAAGQTVTQRFVLGGVAFYLDTVRVATGRSACRMSRDSSAATFAVWEQARTALTATQLTAAERAITATTIAYDRTVDPFFQRVRRQSATIHSALVTQPWQSQSAANLRRGGYVVAEHDTTTYYAPGMDVLLSDSFFEDHCFHLASSPDPTRIGIAFEPSPERRVAEIRGTLWLDRKSSELRRLEFRYANVSRQQEQRAGGDMDFVRMRNGMWAINRWSIRMPVLAERSQTTLLQSEPIVVETTIAGGELSLAMRGRDTLWARNPFVLAGSVVDSLSGKPVPGAFVTLMGTRLAAVTDSAGRFGITGALPGEYTTVVHTPVLDEIDAVSQAQLMFTDSVEHHYIRVPSAQQIRKTLCGELKPPMSGIVVGGVENRNSGLSPKGLRVFAEWNEANVNNAAAAVTNPDRWLETRTDANGRFRVCGLPINTTLQLRAVTEEASVEPVPVVLLEGAIGRAELNTDKLVVRGALFSGLVLADSTRQPIAGAEVSIAELALSTRSNDRGAFRFSEVPAGTYTFTVRRVGYGPLDTKLTFASNRPVDRQIILSRVAVLDSVRVVAGRTELPDFEENRRIGLGQFITRADLAKQSDRRMSAILASSRGIQVVGGTNHAWVASSRGGAIDGVHYPDKLEQSMGAKVACYAQVYLNNARVYRRPTDPLFDINTLSPDGIEAIEYYASAAETPPKYYDPGMPCGVIVIWSRRSP